MRVAVLGIKTKPASAGADRVVEKLLEATGEPGAPPDAHHYTIYLMARRGPRLPDTPTRRHVYLPALPGKHLAASSYFLLCALHATLIGRYDVLHVHNSDFGLFCPLLRLCPGRRIVGTFHGDPYRRAKWGPLARHILHWSERLFVECGDVLTSVSRLKARGSGIWREKPVRYIPNGVDDDCGFDLSDAFDHAAHGTRPRGYLLFACGRLDPTKGLHHLLDAHARLAGAPPLVVVGDFTHDRAYSAMIRTRCDTDDRIVLVERLLPREQLISIVRDCLAFVFPSEVEAMSMMLLEAVSCRRPVVCSDIPENLAVVGEDYAFAYPVTDPGALAERLGAVLAMPAVEQDTVTSELFDRCMAEFSWPRLRRAYGDAYETALAA